jgi:hypothetical protein
LFARMREKQLTSSPRSRQRVYRANWLDLCFNHSTHRVRRQRFCDTGNGNETAVARWLWPAQLVRKPFAN